MAQRRLGAPPPHASGLAGIDHACDRRGRRGCAPDAWPAPARSVSAQVRHTEATETLTRAAAKVGGRWRLVTLDDSALHPMGVGPVAQGMLRTNRAAANAERLTRRLGEIGGALLPFVFYGAAGCAAYAVLVDGVDPLEVFDVWGSTESPALVLAWVLGVVFLGSLAVAGVFLLGSAAVVFAGVTVFGAWSMATDSAREADALKAVRIDRRSAIEPAQRRLSEISRRVFSPRLMVLTVDSSIWQETVRAFASASAVPLIDISEPSENVLWELTELLPKCGRCCVLIGQYERLGRLLDPAIPGSATARLQQLLDGHVVLAYTNTPSGHRRFTRALRKTLGSLDPGTG